MKKNNLVTMGVSFLLCVGMVGAGFASWVISAEVNEELESTVKVEEVIDQRLQLTTSTSAEGSTEKWDADLYFGAPDLTDRTSLPQGITENKGWLKNDGATYEDLDVYFGLTLKYTNLKELADQNLKNITIEISLDKTDELKEYTENNTYFGKTANLLEKPEALQVATKDENDSDFVADKTTIDGFNDESNQPIEVDYQFVNVADSYAIDGFTVTLDVDKLLAKTTSYVGAYFTGENAEYSDKFTNICEFKFIFKASYSWGTLFDKVNPFYFFNNYENTAVFGAETTYANVALNVLTKFEELNAENSLGTSYVIGLTAKVSQKS